MHTFAQKKQTVTEHTHTHGHTLTHSIIRIHIQMHGNSVKENQRILQKNKETNRDFACMHMGLHAFADGIFALNTNCPQNLHRYS